MLSIAAMSAGQEMYYTELAREDYYLEGGEPPGRWLGKGAEALGLEGKVEKRAFALVFAGMSPDGSRSLVQQQVYTDGRQRQPGWDLTFSAPKSVSILWAIAGPTISRQIEEIHFRAVARAVKYLEDEAAFTRRGRGGTDLDRCGLVVATFQHGTSRAQEAQLHTHALLVNMGHRSDGTWGTIRSRDDYLHKMAAGAVYRAALAHDLHHELRVRLGRGDTAFELADVPKDLCDALSTRRAQIKEALANEGSTGAKAAERLAKATREVKGHVAREELVTQWAQVGREHGFTIEEATALVHSAPVLPEHTPHTLRPCIDAAVSQIIESRSHFTEREIVRAVAHSLEHTAVPVEMLFQCIRDHLQQSLQIVRLGVDDGYAQYTTREMYDLEERLLTAVNNSRESTGHIVHDSVLSGVLARCPTIRDEQRQALAHITQSAGSISCLVGMAGTGKTFVLSAAREAWEHAGFRVVGCALAGRAARELETSSGIKSHTLQWTLDHFAPLTVKAIWNGVNRFAHSALLDLKLDLSGFSEKGKRKVRAAVAKNQEQVNAPDAKTIVVLDEAGMVGTAQLERAIRWVASIGAKLVLVGDPAQLQPIEAGGPFKAIIDRLGAARLTDIMRQYEEWMRDAVRQFAEGDARAALTQYTLAGRLKIAPTNEAAAAALIEQWRAKRTSNLADTIILAGTLDEVGNLNRLAQHERRAARELNVDRRGRIGDVNFYEQDRVLFTMNDQRLGVCNGDLGTIELIRSPLIPWKTEVVVRLDRKERLGLFHLHKRVSFSFQEYSDMELGYAITTHKAQGATVERSFVMGGGWMQDRELAYVQMSRAREETWVYAAEADAGEDLSELARSMSRTRAKGLAHDVATQEMAWAQDIQR